MSTDMSSNKPYIVRAFYEWIIDNQLTPYIAVDTTVYGVLVPLAYVNDNNIVLNISPSSVGAISLVDDKIQFSARFGGRLEHIFVPYGAISAIYAKENGAGTSLPIEHPKKEDDHITINNTQLSPKLAPVSVFTKVSKEPIKSDVKVKNKPSLKVIK